MTFEEFIDKYDKEDTIILLEGKRNVIEEDKLKLVSLGKLLALKTKKMKFRSGNASGADFLFFSGISALENERLQVITPYKNHRRKQNNAIKTISIDEINLISEEQVVYQSKNNNKTKNLIDKYVAGNHNQYTIKAAYIIRDTIKAIGTKKIPPTTFAIFYDDLQNPNQGGTGHTIEICKLNKIPFINQTVWFNWIK
ncbi:MAG: hypothetical protein R2836_00015 [Chitinophagales bacterium]